MSMCSSPRGLSRRFDGAPLLAEGARRRNISVNIYFGFWLWISASDFCFAGEADMRLESRRAAL